MEGCSSLYDIVSGTLEKAKLTAELEEAKEEAEKANRAKSQFLARMSHEIRTPVNAVMGMTEMIIRESKEEQIVGYACDVKNSSVELLDIINEILDSSKLESGKMELVCSDYEIAHLLGDLYNMINIKAKEKGLQLFFDIDQTIPSGYNGAPYIREQIDSILCQTDTNWHLTISDDGSTDGTDAIIDEYARQYPDRVQRVYSGRRFGGAKDHFFWMTERLKPLPTTMLRLSLIRRLTVSWISADRT